MTRVLMTCCPGYGHLQPLLPLANALSDAGHTVAVATGAELAPRAEAAGLPAHPAGLTLGAAFQRLAERFPDRPYDRLAPGEILGWYLPHLFGETLAPALLADLARLVHRWRPDILLHDAWEFAGPVAAATAGIPSVSQTLGLRTDGPILDAVGAAVAPLWQERGLDPDPAAGLYRWLCLDTTPPGFQPATPPSRPDVTHPLRPVAQPALRGERLPPWIERRRTQPLVYMTLGTNTNSDLSVFRRVVDGVAGLDVDLLVTMGFDSDPAALGPLASNAHVERYVAQSLLLPHCSAVICHGGAGTTLNSLARGLPLLVLPQGADQYMMGDLVVAAGAGLCLAPSEVDAASIRESVLALLEAPTYRAGARRLQHEIAAMPGPEEAVPMVEAVAAGPTRPRGDP